MKKIEVVSAEGKNFAARFDEKLLKGLITTPLDVEGVHAEVMKGYKVFHLYDSTKGEPKKFLITGDTPELLQTTEYVIPQRFQYVAEDFKEETRIPVEGCTPWEAARELSVFPFFKVGDNIHVTRGNMLWAYKLIAKGSASRENILEFIQAHPFARI